MFTTVSLCVTKRIERKRRTHFGDCEESLESVLDTLSTLQSAADNVTGSIKQSMNKNLRPLDDRDSNSRRHF